MFASRSLPCVAAAGLLLPMAPTETPRAVELSGSHTKVELPLDEGFDGVEIAGFGTLRVTIAEVPSLTVTTDRSYLDRVLHAVEEDAEAGCSVLRLGNVEARDGVRPLLVFDLEVPSLSYLHAMGASVANASSVDLSGESITVLASGKARVMTGVLATEQLNIQASGGSWIRIDGIDADDLAVDAHDGSLVMVEEGYDVAGEVVMLTGVARFENPRTRAVAAANPR